MSDPFVWCGLCKRRIPVNPYTKGFPPDAAKRRLQKLCEDDGCACDPRYLAGIGQPPCPLPVTAPTANGVGCGPQGRNRGSTPGAALKLKGLHALTSPSARKGRRAELDVAAYLRTAGFDYAEPTRRSGWADDRGDIDGIPGVVIEVKDCKQWAVPAWLHELEQEIGNAGATTGVLVVKRRGHISPADWYAITPFADWCHLAKDAGL